MRLVPERTQTSAPAKRICCLPQPEGAGWGGDSQVHEDVSDLRMGKGHAGEAGMGDLLASEKTLHA